MKKHILIIPTLLLILIACSSMNSQRGSIIFIHPDGTGLGHWNAARAYWVGPDHDLYFDKMSHLATYRSHQTDALTTSSNAGATTHAYGIKVQYDSFGMDGTKPILSLSKKPYSIMVEAQKAGINIGIINSGHLAEPGTAVFLSSVTDRKLTDQIIEQLITKEAKVIFGGGEELFLPPEKIGFHKKPGKRKDGRDLIEEAIKLGYDIIYTREQLMKLSPDTKKVLGIFAASDTYNDKEEEELLKKNLPCYEPYAPTTSEMTKKALEILSYDNKQFFLMTEEEGSDNFSNKTNAYCMLEAMKRADDTIGVSFEFLDKHRDTLIFLAADSDAGHPTTYVARDMVDKNGMLLKTAMNGAVIDGVKGSQSLPFISRPDASGKSHPFGITWANSFDNLGSVVARAHGYKSELLGVNIQNTDIYKIFYQVLFNKNL